MKRIRTGFIKNLRYLCLIGVIALGLMTIVGSNGTQAAGSSSGSGGSSCPSGTCYTGGGRCCPNNFPWRGSSTGKCYESSSACSSDRNGTCYGCG